MYGAKITTIWLARGFTQEFMAKKLNMDQASYSKIEHDSKIKITDDLLEKIANTLGVSIEDIKSPTPVVMNFHNSTQSGVYGTQNNGVDKQMTENFLKIMGVLHLQIENQNKILALLLDKFGSN